jgi:hypothetical protein
MGDSLPRFSGCKTLGKGAWFSVCGAWFPGYGGSGSLDNGGFVWYGELVPWGVVTVAVVPWEWWQWFPGHGGLVPFVWRTSSLGHGSLGTGGVVPWVWKAWFIWFRGRGSLGTGDVVPWVQGAWFPGYRGRGSLGTGGVVPWVRRAWFPGYGRLDL